VSHGAPKKVIQTSKVIVRASHELGDHPSLLEFAGKITFQNLVSTTHQSPAQLQNFCEGAEEFDICRLHFQEQTLFSEGANLHKTINLLSSQKNSLGCLLLLRVSLQP
jgi:hypothetical protein